MIMNTLQRQGMFSRLEQVRRRRDAQLYNIKEIWHQFVPVGKRSVLRSWNPRLNYIYVYRSASNPPTMFVQLKSFGLATRHACLFGIDAETVYFASNVLTVSTVVASNVFHAFSDARKENPCCDVGEHSFLP